MKPAAVNALFRKARDASLKKGDWGGAVRNFPEELEGLTCNAHVSVRVWERFGLDSPRVDGECLVYLSCLEGETAIGACGWLRFSASAWLDDRCDLLLACAMREARSRLAARPEFQAVVQRDELLSATPVARAAERRRSL